MFNHCKNLTSTRILAYNDEIMQIRGPHGNPEPHIYENTILGAGVTEQLPSIRHHRRWGSARVRAGGEWLVWLVGTGTGGLKDKVRGIGVF